MVAGLRGVLMLCGWGPFVQLLQPHLSIGCHNCQQQSITRECVDDWDKLNLDDCSEDNCDEDQFWDDTNLERRRPETEEWQRQRLILLVTPSSSSSSLFSNTLVTTDQQHWWILLLQCLLLESSECVELVRLVDTNHWLERTPLCVLGRVSGEGGGHTQLSIS